eukprot:scaffold3311_cov411-Prasinococcus_capsulatus_cf.AAC.8
MIEESSFAVLFPKYRGKNTTTCEACNQPSPYALPWCLVTEKYLREVWPSVTAALKEHGIKCELNLVEGSMTVATTRKAYDPYIIIKARDLIKLLSRSVPAPQVSAEPARYVDCELRTNDPASVLQALKILEDEIECDIIKIGGMVGNKERFVKRRQRLLGPNGSTLKAIEILSQCYVLVQGNTVSVMGPYKGLKTVRRIVEDCMHNVHPVYHVKALMIKRELAKDPEMANENWERFLPKFKNKNVRSKKPKQPREKKAYTPFPPPQQPSKIDLAMESGEYFLSKEEKTRKSNEEKQAKQQNAVAAKKRQREEAFVSPVEEAYAGEPKAKRRIDSEDVKAMAASLKERVGKKVCTCGSTYFCGIRLSYLRADCGL